MINPRTKGQSGEREIASTLDAIVKDNLRSLGMKVSEKPIVQRNQNQSAVGGKDLNGTFGLAIEIKRQENLSINTWWNQCCESAEELGEVPVLLYRQNRKPWKCVTWGSPSEYSDITVRIEMSWEDFLDWFDRVVYCNLQRLALVSECCNDRG